MLQIVQRPFPLVKSFFIFFEMKKNVVLYEETDVCIKLFFFLFSTACYGLIKFTATFSSLRN